MTATVRDVDQLLRIPNFSFTDNFVLGRKHQRAARALGAIFKDRHGVLRVGKTIVVINKLLVIFKSALEIRKRFPTQQLTAEERFWEAVLDNIQEHDKTISDHIKPASLQHVVTTYCDAFHRARADLLAQPTGALTIQAEVGDGNKENRGAPDDPRARLLASVEEWHRGEGPDVLYEGASNMSAPLTSKPVPYLDESTSDFALRLEKFYEHEIQLFKDNYEAEKNRADKLAAAQKLSDERNMQQYETMKNEIDELKEGKRKVELRNEKWELDNLKFMGSYIKLLGENMKLEAKVGRVHVDLDDGDQDQDD